MLAVANCLVLPTSREPIHNMIGDGVNSAKKLRDLAEQFDDMAEQVKGDPERRRYHLLAEGWRALSDTQAWLDGEISPIVDLKEEHVRRSY